MDNQRIYWPRFFREWVLNPKLLIVLFVMVIIIPLVNIGITSSQSQNLSFWDVFWTQSQELYPSPIIKNIPAGIESLIIAIGAWFFIISFLWILMAIFDKVILTNQFLKYGSKAIKLSDIKKITIEERVRISAIEKIYPAVPQPSELPQAVSGDKKTKLDLPGWLIDTKFFEDLKNLAPQIEVNAPQLKAYSRAKTWLIFFVFVAIFLSFIGFFYLVGKIKTFFGF